MKKPTKTEAFHKNLELAKSERQISKVGTQVPVLEVREIIAEGKNLFTEFVCAGLSLLEFAPKLEELKRNKKYKLIGFATWKECCEEGLETSERWVNETIRGAQIRAALPRSEAKKITSISQTRALSNVPEEDRPKVIKAAEKESEVITPKSIKTAHEKVSLEKEADFRVIVKDANDSEVPEEITKEFQRSREEVKEIRSKLQEVKRWFEDEQPLKVEIARTEAIEYVNYLLSLAKVGAGDYLCPHCKGKKCAVCTQRGFVSRLFYTHNKKD